MAPQHTTTRPLASVENINGSTPEIVLLLEHLLQQARDGHITTLAVTASNGSLRPAAAFVLGNSEAAASVMLGRLCWLQHAISAAIAREELNGNWGDGGMPS